MLTVREPVESATGQQAGNIRVAVRRPKTSTKKDENVIENRSAIRIEWIAAAANEVNELGIQLHPFPRPLQVQLV